MKSSLAILLLAALCGAALTGCKTLAEKRVEKHPELFGPLSSREKELVRIGEVAEGMSRDAVYLAWGRPDMVRSGSRDGRGTETWAYFDSAPVHNISIGIGGGYSSFYHDFGFHPRFGYGVGPGWTYGTGVDFVSHVSKTVEFSNDRVIAWERRR